MTARDAAGADTFNVYVVRLSERVWGVPAFRADNPGADRREPCFYVGMTGLSPEERFARHRAGVQSGRGIVRLFGLALEPALYAHLNPMSRKEAERREVILAAELQRKGHGVWQR